MDPATKEQFKWKFYKLQIMINIFVLLFAVGFLLLFLAPEPARIPAFFILFLSGLVILLYTGKKYRETKAWLKEHE